MQTNNIVTGISIDLEKRAADERSCNSENNSVNAFDIYEEHLKIYKDETLKRLAKMFSHS